MCEAWTSRPDGVASTTPISVSSTEDVIRARRTTTQIAIEAGLPLPRSRDAGLVSTELATNLVKHAGGGVILVTSFVPGSIDIVALDRGPGTSDLTRVVRDGQSSTRTLGLGLGSIARASDSWEAYSIPQQGFALWARIGTAPGGSTTGLIHLSPRGQVLCGDGWWIERRRRGWSAALFDGSGHGAPAWRAARTGLAVIQQDSTHEPLDILRAAHLALGSTRRAVGCVAAVRSNQLRFAGVGDIGGALVQTEGAQRLLPVHGTLGGNVRTLRCQQLDLTPPGVVVLHSDGLAARWSAGRYPDRVRRCAPLLAALLHRDFGRRHDDATVLILGIPPGNR